MIDNNELKKLKLGKLACVFNGDVAIVHSQWFVLELPKEEIQTVDWASSTTDLLRQWRYELVPQDAVAEKAQPMQVTWEDEEDGDDEYVRVIQLMSENLQGFISVPLYNFIRRNTEEATFRLYAELRPDGSPPNVAVYSKEKLVGVVAQIVKVAEQEEKGWRTSI